ncbi:hypothetical protein VF21_08492 [Pseudogymnoascus sp. 05NY08]|nr:hypothetical protein VF21_08492 [Pseudogymnoascus sp. 05NY08]
MSAFLSMLMIYPINTYAPSLIKSLGFGGYNANGLNSVESSSPKPAWVRRKHLTQRGFRALLTTGNDPLRWQCTSWASSSLVSLKINFSDSRMLLDTAEARSSLQPVQPLEQ